MSKKRNYAAEYARRKAQARAEGFGSYWQKRIAREQKVLSLTKKLSPLQEAQKNKAYRAFLEIEKGKSLSQAARNQHITPNTVRRYMSQRLEKRGSRWMPSEGYLRHIGVAVNIITVDGMKQVLISSNRTRSRYASYLNAVKGALHSWPDSMIELQAFEGRTFKDASGEKHAFITDRKLLIRLYDDDRLEMESFYAELAR